MRADDKQVNDRIEDLFEKWAREVHLASKLRTMRHAKAVDGEVFAVLTTNRRIESPVKLDVQLIECDRVTSPLSACNAQAGWASMTADDIDGIRPLLLVSPQQHGLPRAARHHRHRGRLGRLLREPVGVVLTLHIVPCRRL